MCLLVLTSAAVCENIIASFHGVRVSPSSATAPRPKDTHGLGEDNRMHEASVFHSIYQQ